MSSSLRSSRSQLLRRRRCRPAQPPRTRRDQQKRAPAPLPPAASPPATQLAHSWFQKLLKVVAVTCSAMVSLLTDAAVGFECYKETVPYTNRVHRVILSPSDEKKRGHLTSDGIKEEHSDDILGPSHPDTIRVRRIANDIIRGIHRVLLSTNKRRKRHRNKERREALPQTRHLRGLKWEIFVVRDEYHNAYSRSAGKIVIYTGLLNLLDTDAEIATFLAHEIGHVVARHFVEFDLLAELHIPFLSELLSRRNEKEADHIGLMLLAAAGFDPRIAPRIFQRRGQAREESAWKDYIGSHPSWKTRSWFLSQDKVMEKALQLYHGQVRAKKGYYSFFT